MIKGDNGIVGVFGGSKEYTGAPYFCAQSALRGGADLSYVFCHSYAAQTIKSLAPDLIVLPFDDTEVDNSLKMALKRAHCLVVGPGLSRNEHIFNLTADLISTCDVPTVIVDGVPSLPFTYRTE